MKCKEAHKQFLFLADDLLSESVKNELIQHISECEKCSQLYAKISNHYKLLKSDKIQEANPFFYARFEKSLENKPHSISKVRRWQSVLEPFVLAAVIVVGLFLGVMIGNKTQLQADNENIQSEVESVFNLDENDLAYESVEAYLMENE